MQRAPRTVQQRRLDFGLIAFAVFTVVAVIAALLWNSRPAQSSAPQVNHSAPQINHSAERVKFAAVGDSITAANSESIVAGKAGDMSWVYYADRENVDLVGGWAEGGATTADMATGVKEVVADVLVILAGTNDVGQDIPFSETTANLEMIVEKTGVEQVVVSSIPPRNEKTKAASEFNDKLQNFVEDKEWQWADASAVLRDGKSYKDELTNDGIHPTQQGQKLLGAELHAAIIDG